MGEGFKPPIWYTPSMSRKKIKVTAYSGYRGEEKPRAFVLEGERIGVLETLRAWVEEAPGDRARKRFYVVKGSDGHVHKIFYDEENGEWFSVG